MNRSGFVIPLLGAVAVALVAGSCIAGSARAEPNPDRLEMVTATPTEVPRVRPASRSGREAVVDLAERHFPAYLVPWALRVAACESSFDLFAHSAGYDRRYGWYEHVGAFQISTPTWAAKARELFGGELTDPEVNFAMAAWIVTNLGPSHWPVCSR